MQQIKFKNKIILSDETDSDFFPTFEVKGKSIKGQHGGL